MPDEELVVSVVNSEKWRKRVYYVPYYLPEDPSPGLKYAPITWSTVVINQKLKLTDLTEEKLEQGLQQGLETAMTEDEIRRATWDREPKIEIVSPRE